MFAIYSSDLGSSPSRERRMPLHGIDRATVIRVIADIWFPRTCEFENSCRPKLSVDCEWSDWVSDMRGNAARVAKTKPGGERMNNSSKRTPAAAFSITSFSAFDQLAVATESGSRRFFLGHRFFADSDTGKLHDAWDRLGVSILTERRFERQFSVSDLA